jgi:iron complex transport system substrate-binding protein
MVHAGWCVMDRPALFKGEGCSLHQLDVSGSPGLVVTAGGDDVFADVKQQSLQASLEIVLARAPDVIIETHPTAGWTPDVIRRDIALWSRLTTIPAVRNGRVYILAEDRLLIPGPRVTLAVRALAEVLHPEIKR